MRRERLNIAYRVARQLGEAERANDMAIISTAKLATAMLEARISMNVAACIGQPAFDAVAATFERQAASRRLLVEAHASLQDAQRFVGLGEENIGGAGDKQVPTFTGSLQLVTGLAA